LIDYKKMDDFYIYPESRERGSTLYKSISTLDWENDGILEWNKTNFGKFKLYSMMGDWKPIEESATNVRAQQQKENRWWPLPTIYSLTKQVASHHEVGYLIRAMIVRRL